jgi:hypothetical protein
VLLELPALCLEMLVRRRLLERLLLPDWLRTLDWQSLWAPGWQPLLERLLHRYWQCL